MRVDLLFGFEQNDQADVVLGHHAIHHVVAGGTVGGRDGQLIELDELLFDQTKPAMDWVWCRARCDRVLLRLPIEYGATVDVSTILFAHRLRARLGTEDTVVAMFA